MKKIFSILFAVILQQLAMAQNVGIGTNAPSEKLEVNGGLKIGATNNTAPGTIRWNASKNDFEGYNGTNWVSLTGSKGSWGPDANYVQESSASQVRLYFDGAGLAVGKRLGQGLALMNNFLLAGAPDDYSPGGTVSYAGSVRILKKENGSWVPHEELSAPESPLTASRFGYSVGADNSSFIVGAYMANVGSNYGQGKAHIYGMNPDGTPVFQASLTGSNGSTNDNFGSSVAISGHYAIAGATGYDSVGKESRGIAYIFYKNIYNATWSQQTILHPPDGMAEDNFGYRVAISGTTAVVASHHANYNNIPRVGKVYVYNLINNVWTYSQTIIPPSPLAFDRFGSALSLKGDTLIVGSTQYNGSQGSNNGKVYVYVRSNNNWGLQATLTATDGKKEDAFGTSVHFNNGYIIAGAKYATVGPNDNQGKAYIFKLNNNTWEQQAILTASGGEYGDSFGECVVLGSSGAVVSSIMATFRNYPQHGRLYFYEE